MTPCEKLGYKVGDRFVCIEGNALVERSEGDILILIEDDGDDTGIFKNETTGKEITVCMYSRLMPILTKTEAEKRGAKFGVAGVIKSTGKKCVYLGESLVLPGYWEIDAEGAAERWHRKPSEIRLDHEPEYKEIPFSEATDEQRLNVDNLIGRNGEKVRAIKQFSSGIFGFTIKGSSRVFSDTDRLTVRVPA